MAGALCWSDRCRQAALGADPGLAELLEELLTHPVPTRAGSATRGFLAAWPCPLQLMVGDQVLSFLSTVTVFGAALDITLSELSLETFFPADQATTEALRAL